MAIIDDVRKPRTENTTPLQDPANPPKPNSFGDAAAASANPGVTQLPAPGLLAQQPADPMKAHQQRLDAANELQAWRTTPPLVQAGQEQARRQQYQTLQETANDMSPSYFSQDTPMSVQARASAESAASSALQNIYKPQTSAQTLPSTNAGAGRGSVNPPMADPNAPRPTVAPPDNPNNITRVGNSYSGGPNISGDITVNGKEPGGGFMVAPGQTYPAPGLMGQTAAQQLATAPQVQHSGNSFAARKALENAATSASSITNDGGSWDKHRGISPARAAYDAMFKHDLAMQGAQPGMDAAVMKENAATGRTAMQEGGQNSRFGQTQGIALSKLAMEQQAAGYQNRAAAQQEGLRNVLLDSQATPEQRKVAQRSLSALAGKTAADRMQTVALPDTTTDTGAVVRGGQALVRTLEDGTVEQVPIGGRKPLKETPETMDIKNNANMSREQKVAALEKLGH